MQNIIKTLSLFIILFLYCFTSNSSETDEDLRILENYLNSINNMSFTFSQVDHKEQKEIGWMQIVKPNKLRIEYKGENDLIILANSNYLVLYKAKDDIITSLSNDGPWNIFTKTNIKVTKDLNNPDLTNIRVIFNINQASRGRPVFETKSTSEDIDIFYETKTLDIDRVNNRHLSNIVGQDQSIALGGSPAVISL